MLTPKALCSSVLAKVVNYQRIIRKGKVKTGGSESEIEMLLLLHL